MRATIDTQTGRLVGVDYDARYTRSAIDSIDVSCPKCRSMVVVAAVDCGNLANTAEPQRFAIGRAKCVRGCNLKPGEAED